MGQKRRIVRTLMKAQTISEIAGLPAKAIVYAFEGVVSKVFDRKTGQNSNGDWSIQSLMVKDPTGAEIKVMLKDREAFGYGVGTAIRLEAKQSDKGFSGLYAEDDDYKGKVTRLIKVTPSAMLCRLDGAAPAAQPQQAAPQAQPARQGQGWDEPAPQTQPYRQTPQAAQHVANAQGQAASHGTTPIGVKRTMIQIANLYLESLLATRYVAETYKEKTGMDMSDAQRQACASSIFIKADRLNLHAEMPQTKM